MSGSEPWPDVPLKGIMARWEALIIRWDLKGEECSALLGRGDGPVDEVSSYGLETAESRMRLLIALEPMVTSVFDGDEERVRAWLRRPKVELRMRTPLDVMMRSPERLRWLVLTLGIAA